MPRLIDIEKRLEEWRKLLAAYFPNLPCQTFAEFLINTPTVDAVEVVRCKDCKSYCEATAFTPAYCTVCGEQKTDEDFCSWGERIKENAAD